MMMRNLTTVPFLIACLLLSMVPANATVPRFNGDVVSGAVPTFNVLFYGADPTNSRSSVAAINSAFTACNNAGGGIVYAPQGTYMIDATMTIPNNCSLIGAGWQATTLQAKTGSSILDIIYQGQTSNVTIQGITFDANNVVGAGGIQFYNSVNSRITVRDCDFKRANGTWAVVIGGITSGTFTNTTTDSLFLNNILESNATSTKEAVILSSWQNGIVAGNRFENNSGTNNFLFGLYGYSSHVIVANNVFASTGVVGGSYVQQGQFVTFSGNHYVEGASWSTGLQIINSQNVTAENEYFDMSSSSSGPVGISVNDFSGTTFDGNTAVFQNSAYLNIIGNTFIGGYTGIDLPSQNGGGHNVAQSHVFIASNTDQGSTQANLLVVNGTNATAMSDIRVTGNYIAPGSWTGNAAINFIGGNANVTNVTVANNVVGYSGGAGAHGITVSGAFPSVYVYGNDLAQWGTTGLFATGGATVVDGANLTTNGLQTGGTITAGGKISSSASILAGSANSPTVQSGDIAATRNTTGGVLWLGGSAGSCTIDYGIITGSKVTVNCNTNIAGVLSATNHNACSSTSGVPCEGTMTCSLSSATTCNATVTVPTGAICSASANASDTTTGTESWYLSLSTNTLTVTARVSASQTSTAAANVACL